MDKRSKWQAGGWSAKVYFTLKRAAPKGMVFRSLSQELNPTQDTVDGKAIENTVLRLKQQGLVEQPAGKFTELRVDDAMPPPPYKSAELATFLLAQLADCQGGCSESLLAEDAHVCRAEVHFALQAQLLLGHLRIIQVPGDASLGGGLGYAMQSSDQARPETADDDAAPMWVGPAPAAAAAVCRPSPCLLGRHGNYHLDQGRLAIAWGGGALRVELPPDVTRELFRWLDALGGLQLAERVDQAGAAS